MKKKKNYMKMAFNKRLEKINKYIAEHEDDPEGYVQRAKLSIGVGLGEKERIEKAIADCNKAISLAQDCAEAYFLRACFFEKKYPNMFIADLQSDYEHAIKLTPENDEYLLRYGDYCYRNISANEIMIEKCQWSYEQLVRLGESSEYYCQRLLSVSKELNDTDVLVRVCSLLIEIYPDEIDYYRDRAKAFFKMGKLENVKDDYTRIVEIMKSPRDILRLEVVKATLDGDITRAEELRSLVQNDNDWYRCCACRRECNKTDEPPIKQYYPMPVFVGFGIHGTRMKEFGEICSSCKKSGKDNIYFMLSPKGL